MLVWTVMLAVAGWLSGRAAADHVCGGTITTPDSVLRSPGFPDGYPDDLNCVWDVTPPGDNTQIYFQFLDFDLVPGDELILLTADGNNVIATFTGQAFNFFFGPPGYPPLALNAPAEGVRVVFNTNNDNSSGRGFRIRISWSRCPKKCLDGRNTEIVDKPAVMFEDFFEPEKQCVCEGCGPEFCPALCAYGDNFFTRPGQDCRQCFCQAPSCQESCCRTEIERFENNDDFYCDCDERIVGDASGSFELGYFAANFFWSRLTLNGQTRLVCDPDLLVSDLSVDLASAVCRDMGLEVTGFPASEVSFDETGSNLFGITLQEAEGAQAWVLDPSCSPPPPGAPLEDYAACIQEAPIPVTDCPGEFIGAWCTPGAFRPLFGLPAAQQEEAMAMMSGVQLTSRADNGTITSTSMADMMRQMQQPNP